VAGALGRLQDRLDRLLAAPEIGREPASSPTAVDSPRSWRTDFKAIRLRADPHRLEKLATPAGTTMNSCRSMVLSAWAPPLITFIIGTGKTRTSFRRDSGRARHRPGCGRLRRRERHAEDGVRAESALFGVPSSSISVRSSPAWSAASAR
jgi:hypothetical protein